MRPQEVLIFGYFWDITAKIFKSSQYSHDKLDPLLGNASNYSEEGSPNIEIASAAKLMAIAKRTGATVYILDTGEKESNKERLLSAVAQASGGLYESTTKNKALEMRQVKFKFLPHVPLKHCNAY